MKLIIGSDHAGFDAKEFLKKFIEESGHETIDAGTTSTESCHYPDYAAKIAGAVSRGEADRGVLVCGTGIGMCISANKFKRIRAALCHSVETARLSRAHNDANIICLGARSIDRNLLADIIKVWLNTGFEGGRHATRLAKIEELEQE